jgi:hypothetical protein
MHGVYKIIQSMRSTRDRSEIELRQTRPYPGAIGKIGGGLFASGDLALSTRASLIPLQIAAGVAPATA